MSFVKTPIAKIRKALAMCEAAGLAVTAKDLEFHYFSGGDPVVLADALVTAKQLRVTAGFQEISAVSLAGHNPRELIVEAAKPRSVRIDTFSPKRDDKIRGFTRDQREVLASISVVFRLSPGQLAFHFDFRHVHERLSAAVSVYINTASDYRSLQLKKPEHEAELRVIALDMIPGFISATIDYL